MQEVKQINVPKLQELSLKSLGASLAGDERLAQYLPDKWQEKGKLDRVWVFNVINSVYPGYLEQVIGHAQRQRQQADGEEEAKETITVSEEWRRRLAETTFISK